MQANAPNGYVKVHVKGRNQASKVGSEMCLVSSGDKGSITAVWKPGLTVAFGLLRDPPEHGVQGGWPPTMAGSFSSLCPGSTQCYKGLACTHMYKPSDSPSVPWDAILCPLPLLGPRGMNRAE